MLRAKKQKNVTANLAIRLFADQISFFAIEKKVLALKKDAIIIQ